MIARLVKAGYLRPALRHDADAVTAAIARLKLSHCFLSSMRSGRRWINCRSMSLAYFCATPGKAACSSRSASIASTQLADHSNFLTAQASKTRDLDVR
jgi:hypothetical protein